jgi:hypothetical protein
VSGTVREAIVNPVVGLESWDQEGSLNGEKTKNGKYRYAALLTVECSPKKRKGKQKL